MQFVIGEWSTALPNGAEFSITVVDRGLTYPLFRFRGDDLPSVLPKLAGFISAVEHAVEQAQSSANDQPDVIDLAAGMGPTREGWSPLRIVCGPRGESWVLISRVGGRAERSFELEREELARALAQALPDLRARYEEAKNRYSAPAQEFLSVITEKFPWWTSGDALLAKRYAL